MTGAIPRYGDNFARRKIGYKRGWSDTAYFFKGDADWYIRSDRTSERWFIHCKGTPFGLPAHTFTEAMASIETLVDIGLIKDHRPEGYTVPSEQDMRQAYSLPCIQPGCHGLFDAYSTGWQHLTGWWWPTGTQELEGETTVHDHRLPMRTPRERISTLMVLQAVPGVTSVEANLDGYVVNCWHHSFLIGWHGEIRDV